MKTTSKLCGEDNVSKTGDQNVPPLQSEGADSSSTRTLPKGLTIRQELFVAFALAVIGVAFMACRGVDLPLLGTSDTIGGTKIGAVVLGIVGIVAGALFRFHPVVWVFPGFLLGVATYSLLLFVGVEGSILWFFSGWPLGSAVWRMMQMETNSVRTH